jgi:SpoVK/Ycf46/Vps4 family AAA+-type ATPase
MRKILGNKNLSYDADTLDLAQVAMVTEGCLGADLKVLVERAMQAASMRYIKAKPRGARGTFGPRFSILFLAQRVHSHTLQLATCLN